MENFEEIEKEPNINTETDNLNDYQTPEEQYPNTQKTEYKTNN